MTLLNCCCPAGKKLPIVKNSLHMSANSITLDSGSSKANWPLAIQSFKTIFLKFLSYISLIFIGLYRSVFTAHFGAGVCRFEPTCSAYANQAFLKYPFFTAFKLTLKRLSKCYPGSSFGYDPLPKLSIQTNFPSEITHECR